MAALDDIVSKERSETPVVAEIASLLDQCSPDELANILQAIEGGGLSSQVEQMVAQELPSRLPKDATATNLVASSMSEQAQSQVQPAPVPPSGPPPSGNGRRPNPGVKKASENASPEAYSDENLVSMSDMSKLLEEHSSCVMSEVRKMLPTAGSAESARPQQSGSGNNMINMDVLANVLAVRDREVKELEARLQDLNTVLASKDQRVANLTSELDMVVRGVRHRQLDLEFQQLKLEERTRSNNELEQAQRQLQSRIEEADLYARHAALDADMSRTTPRSVRVQGSLPWTLRKSRPALPAS